MKIKRLIKTQILQPTSVKSNKRQQRKLERQIEHCERQIEELEAQISHIEEQLTQPEVFNDPLKASKFANQKYRTKIRTNNVGVGKITRKALISNIMTRHLKVEYMTFRCLLVFYTNIINSLNYFHNHYPQSYPTYPQVN